MYRERYIRHVCKEKKQSKNEAWEGTGNEGKH